MKSRSDDGQERGAAAEAAFLRAIRNMADGGAKFFSPAQTRRLARRRVESRRLGVSKGITNGFDPINFVRSRY